jgi:hypothetical protein
MEDESNEAVRGEYSKFYETFQLIGNGAFGSVKLAARKDTGLLVCVKITTFLTENIFFLILFRQFPNLCANRKFFLKAGYQAQNEETA